MAGRGPAPKPADRRARRNQSAGPAPTIIEHIPVDQPPLPEDLPWPEQTVRWWEMWRESPLSRSFGLTDWAFLLDTALLHAQLWGACDMSVMGELRLRVAKFGATPEDRARLRIQFAEADAADADRPAPPTAAQRYGATLKAVPSAPTPITRPRGTRKTG